MGESSKVGISASKVVALIGTLILIRDSISYFYTTDWLAILLGIIGLIIAFVVFDSLEIIDFKKLAVPYIWWVLLIIGFLLFLFEFLVGPNYLAGILVIIAAILEFFGKDGKMTFPASKVVGLIGAGFVILEAVPAILGPNIVSAIIALIFAVVLVLSAIKFDIKVPYSWWVVLIIGFVIFTWFYMLGGTIILIAFILILMAY